MTIASGSFWVLSIAWGAPRIHGELLKLGFEVSERTVLRWVQRVPNQ